MILIIVVLIVRVYCTLDFMNGFYNRFNNLRFNIPHNINDYSAAHVVIDFASSGIMTCSC